MVIRRLFGLCLVALMAAPALAAAQDTRKVGITIAYPASIGVLWHASDKIASVAFAAGFGDVSYFYRAFRRRYDLLPTDVRAQAGGLH